MAAVRTGCRGGVSWSHNKLNDVCVPPHEGRRVVPGVLHDHHVDRALTEHLAQIGAELRQLRMAAKLTQADVGRRAGMTRQLVSRVESGRVTSEVWAVAAVASAVQHRLAIVPEVALNEHELAAIELAEKLNNPRGMDS